MSSTCRFCGAPLDALTRRRGVDHCGASLCRHRATEVETELRRVAAGDEMIAAAREQGALRGPPDALVWLKRWEPEMTPLTEGERAEHRAYLESVVAEGMVIDRTRLAESTADDRHPQGARLCAQCRGRCCFHGAAWRAFTDLRVLDRWVEEHPGAGYAEAVEAYVGMLPAAHVRDACLYQTATGCAMPRERRAEICNGFACDALQQVQQAAARSPAAQLVAITFHRDRVERAAVIGPEETVQIGMRPAESAVIEVEQ